MKNNGKIIKSVIIGIVIIALVILLISIYNYIQDNKNNYKIEEIQEYLYFKLYKNEKYGVINKNGDVLVEASYDLIEIPNPSKDIFICYYDYNSTQGEYKTKVLNSKNEEIFKEYEQVLPLMFKEMIEKVPYEKSVLKYKENEKYGIIDFKGNKITDAIYDSIESILYKEGCLKIEQEGKFGVINITGKEIIRPLYSSITADGYYDETTKYQYAGFILGNRTDNGYRYGYAKYNGNLMLLPEYNEINRISDIKDKNKIYLLTIKNGQAGINENKKVLIENKYEEIEYNKINQLFIVQENSKQGVINIKGKQVIKDEYDYIFISGKNINAEIGKDLYTFDINGIKKENVNYSIDILTKNENYIISINTLDKFGVKNSNGDVLVKNEYQYIEYAFENYFIATKDSKVGVIDNNENTIIEFKYDTIEKIGQSNVLQAILNDSNIIELYNKDLEKVIELQNPSIYQKEGYIKIQTDNIMKYYNNDGFEMSNKDIYLNNTIFASQSNEKWGFVDKNNNIIIEPIYDIVTEVNEYGYAGIRKDNKWGIIDLNGNIIVEPIYNIEWREPEFIGKYCKLDFGYGLEYYTDELTK